MGKKEINKKGQKGREYRLVPAVWPAIIEEETFEKVQRLMAANGRSNHNGSTLVRHTYALVGLLRCGRCRGPMKGRSGTGKLKVTYYYYACVDNECGIRVAAEEVEGAVLDRLGVLAREEQIVDQLVARTNARLQRQAPGLLKQRQELQRRLDEVNRTADKLLTGWASLEDDSISSAFISDKLHQLSRQRSDLESGIAEINGALDTARQRAVDAADIRRAMVSISQVYNHLQPFEQKELMQLILQGAEINEREMMLEIRTGACVGESEAPGGKRDTKGKLRFEPPKWLPVPVSHRTLKFSFKCHLPSLIQLRNRETNHRIKQGTSNVVA